MIEYIKGELTDLTPTMAVLETAGVGYGLNISLNTYTAIQAKAKTIEKFLGKDFKVLSSYGHIRDLKKKEFSIDVEKNFTPSYEIPADKKALVNTLKTEAKDAEMWLALTLQRKK